MLGQCANFEAVPGHGLRCTVSGIHSFTIGDTNGLKPLEGAPEGTYEVTLRLIRVL